MREDRLLRAAQTYSSTISLLPWLAVITAIPVAMPVDSTSRAPAAGLGERSGVAGNGTSVLSLIRASSDVIAHRATGRRGHPRGHAHTAGIYNTTSLLAQVKRAAQNSVQGVKLDPESTEILVSITDSMVEEILPDIFQQHEESQAAVNLSAEAVSTCGVTLDGHRASLPPMNASVNEKRDDHSECRDEYLDAVTLRKSAEDFMEAFLNTLEPPEEGCVVPVQQSTNITAELLSSTDVEDWLQGLIDWGVDNLALYDQAYEDCKLNMSHTCDTKQMAFESAFCQYREVVVTVCEDYSECYSTTTRLFNETVEEETLECQRLKNEYESLEMILCYLGVLTFNYTSVEAQDAALASCENKVVDTSPLNLTIPDLPPEQACPEENSVAIYPGHPDWIVTEYEGFDSYVADVLPCTPAALQNASSNSSTSSSSNASITGPTNASETAASNTSASSNDSR